ncbi:hypothetical protein EVAR_93262_1 [Eumeta japonica]|uniref:Uncharacterized protein n=1 Tax=Eumeta variegata TaxID=151549 RepID=A0A4C1TY98_EUMVA|nr:hypothetical protein EVAR_93262_1 [Eumeta japonica]
MGHGLRGATIGQHHPSAKKSLYDGGRWCAEFKRGRTFTKDGARSGRPTTMVTKVMVKNSKIALEFHLILKKSIRALDPEYPYRCTKTNQAEHFQARASSEPLQ